MKQLLVFLFAVICSFLFIQNTQALSSDLISDTIFILDENSEDDNSECGGVFGEETITLLQDIFDIIKFATPILVFALTVIEYTKAVVSSDKDILMKATKVTIKRLILGVCLFMIPVLLNFLFDLLGWYGTCGIG